MNTHFAAAGIDRLQYVGAAPILPVTCICSYLHRPARRRDIVDLPSPACACGRLRRATRALTQLYDDAMAPVGLRVTQFSLLRTLARDGPLRISELAERQLLDRTALSRNLDPLVDHGYIEIIRGDDARTREVALTRNGKAALKRAEPCWTQAQKIVAKRLGAERLEALITTLGELESLHPSNRPSPRRLRATERDNIHVP
jgi:DNA-binding MarR family transcriptional regulator